MNSDQEEYSDDGSRNSADVSRRRAPAVAGAAGRQAAAHKLPAVNDQRNVASLNGYSEGKLEEAENGRTAEEATLMLNAQGKTGPLASILTILMSPVCAAHDSSRRSYSSAPPPVRSIQFDDESQGSDTYTLALIVDPIMIPDTVAPAVKLAIQQQVIFEILINLMAKDLLLNGIPLATATLARPPLLEHLNLARGSGLIKQLNRHACK
ncbi:hypothetical protein THAOC_04311 [Thalassiosira oceanica]|uniref:Uncharacterized protein n=1 Tax=Thalassiosira oceanica TaxID=159749 RepID=K0T5I8_THAOC|nr:hypothetical protein THAOC_04311 [Thalassiosira oceanica]|eukprot:EJK74038.1 hypothetical protein THAOC_04311 [Thalassiosira oceanica]